MKSCSVLFLGLLALAASGCGDDDASDDVVSDGGEPDAKRPDQPRAGRGGGPMAGSTGSDAGGDAGPTADAGDMPDGSMMDSAMPPDDDAGDDPDPNAFSVPAAGGAFAYMTPSGIEVTFDFPASAGGMDISVTPVDAADIDWGDEELAGSFAQVLTLSPDGATFADPIHVSFSDGSLIAFNFSDTSGVPEPLELAADGQSLLLTHFSSLAIVAPNQSCQSTSGWGDDADSARCDSAGSATSYRHYTCKNYQFCYLIEAGCCVEPGDTEVGCQVGDAEVALRYTRTDSNGGAYPYCDVGYVVSPYVSDLSPDDLLANSTDQEITLTGTDFDQDGSVFVNSDQLIATNWVSATEVTAIVPGSLLTANGTLSGVGFVNPDSDATGACDAQNTGNCDWVHRSNLTNMPILATQVQVDPTVTDFSPDSLIADSSPQVLTLTGTDFEVGGSIFTNLDVLLTTTRVSATEAYATVSGSVLTAVGNLNQVGYVNPTASATGSCTAQSTGNCDWNRRSNTVTVPISAAPSGNPAVTSVAPTTLLANSTDQTITLYGTNFDNDGSVYIFGDLFLVTSWVSATQATATVPASQLTNPGTITMVGYMNPTAAATGACGPSNPGNCDFANKSNEVSITKQ